MNMYQICYLCMLIEVYNTVLQVIPSWKVHFYFWKKGGCIIGQGHLKEIIR